MRHADFLRRVLSLLAISMLVFSLGLIGCDDNDNDDDLEADDLSGRTFAFDASALDPALAGQQATLVFGAVTADDTLPFTLTAGTNTVTGTATVSSIDLLVASVNGNSTPGASVTIGSVTYTVGEITTFDAEIDRSDDQETITITFPGGDAVDFVFVSPDDNDATGTTGSTGDT